MDIAVTGMVVVIAVESNLQLQAAATGNKQGSQVSFEEEVG